MASESVALEGTAHQFERDIAPGEAVFVDLDGTVHAEQCAANPQLKPCIFEFVYLARPDSVLDGISVYQARLNLGETLAKRVALAVFAASATFAAFAIFAAVARGKGATLQPAQCQRYHRHGVAGKNTANPWLKLAQLAAGRRALFGKDQHQLAPDQRGCNCGIGWRLRASCISQTICIARAICAAGKIRRYGLPCFKGQRKHGVAEKTRIQYKMDGAAAGSRNHQRIYITGVVAHQQCRTFFGYVLHLPLVQAIDQINQHPNHKAQ